VQLSNTPPFRIAYGFRRDLLAYRQQRQALLLTRGRADVVGANRRSFKIRRNVPPPHPCNQLISLADCRAPLDRAASVTQCNRRRPDASQNQQVALGPVRDFLVAVTRFERTRAFVHRFGHFGSMSNLRCSSRTRKRRLTVPLSSQIVSGFSRDTGARCTPFALAPIASHMRRSRSPRYLEEGDAL
jgi:hypothetical protein